MNDCIAITNEFMEPKYYSLIGVVHHLDDTVSNGHYICQCLINGIWHYINDNVIKT